MAAISRRAMAMVCLHLALGACGDTGSPPVATSMCVLQTLPLAGATDAPSVTDVGLEIQANGIVPVATASDPQGFGNVDGVLQTIGVYPDARCEGVPIEVQDDLAGVGVEETFGTAVPATRSELYAAISAAATWPVRVRFADIDGNVTEGDVSARLIR